MRFRLAGAILRRVCICTFESRAAHACGPQKNDDLLELALSLSTSVYRKLTRV